MNTLILCPRCSTAVAEITPISTDAEPVMRRQSPGKAVKAGAEQIARYLAARVDEVPGHKIPSYELRADYDQWSAQRGLPKLSDRAFGSGLQLNGVERWRSAGVRYYLGVRLRP